MSGYERHLTLEALIEEYGLSINRECEEDVETERAELLRRFTALEAERDALKLRLAETQNLMCDMHTLMDISEPNHPTTGKLFSYLQDLTPSEADAIRRIQYKEANSHDE